MEPVEHKRRLGKTGGRVAPRTWLGALTRLDDGTLDYRYELTDPLGNARVVFHQPNTAVVAATMEPGAASPEERDFLHVATTRFAAPGRGGRATGGRRGIANGLSVGPGNNAGRGAGRRLAAALARHDPRWG